MKYACIESIEEFDAGRYRVRLWIDETAVQNEYDNAELRSVVASMSHLPMGEFADFIAAQPRVNAVQVKPNSEWRDQSAWPDRPPNPGGILIYVNW